MILLEVRKLALLKVRPVAVTGSLSQAAEVEEIK